MGQVVKLRAVSLTLGEDRASHRKFGAIRFLEAELLVLGKPGVSQWSMWGSLGDSGEVSG